jgi:LruC domain-containing protein
MLRPASCVLAPLAITLGLALPAAAQDSDADGTRDALDGFPCEAGAVGEAFAPARGVHGLLLFEDQWPEVGDEDFNDVAVTYNAMLKVDAQGRAVALRLTLNVVGLGGVYDNGLGLHLPVLASEVASAARTVGAGAPAALVPSAADAELDLVVSTDLRELFGGAPDQINSLPTAPAQVAPAVVVDVTFAHPVALTAGSAPYDLYIFRSADRGHQIHRPEFPGTALMNAGLFGTADDGSTASRRFVDTRGLPFALVLPEDAAYPAEAQPLSSLYPDVLTFAASGGALAKDFYATNVQAGFLYRDSAGQPAPSPVFLGLDHFDNDTSCVGGTYSGACADFASLGFPTREACLGDGLWHDLGHFGAQSPVPASDNLTIDALVKRGADFKVHWPGANRAIVDVERIIPECDISNGSCFYARREYGVGLATMGLYVREHASNGYFWLGSARDPFSLGAFFEGTAANLSTGYVDYQLKVRPGAWRVLGTFSAGVPVPQAAFDELRALAERGANFKLAPASGTTYDLIHRVVRVIPNAACGPECMWFYALREASDGGERNLGVAVSRGTSGGVGAVNGDYWVGTPVPLNSAATFFGPTNTTHAAGRFDYTLYVDDDLSPGTPAYSSSCADAVVLGWSSEDACLRDGRWHRVVRATAGQPLTAAELARVDALVASGADFKVRSASASNGGIIPVERVIPNPAGAPGHWFYARREYGIGLATIGFEVRATNINGNYWIGSAAAVGDLQGFFTGTSGNLGSGSFSYDLYARAGGWRELFVVGPQVPLTSTQLEEVRTLALRGANFKVAPTTITYKAQHPVVRVIPNVTNGDMWMYAKREATNGGEITYGMALSSSTRNGNYWIGAPVNVTDMSSFFGGTNGSVTSGYLGYRLFVEE